MAKVGKEYQEWFAQTVRNPSAWVSSFLRNPTDPQLALDLRSYQDEVLQNTKDHRRMVLRYGRRMGKCAQVSDIVRLTTGERITIGELWKRYKSGESLRLLQVEEDISITKSKPILMEDNGFKKTFEVKTRSGRKINITENHPLLRIDGWQPVADLNIGDQILVPSKITYNSTKKIEDYKVKFLAYLLSDCCITKSIPNEIFELTLDQKALFLSILFECDGWASVSKSGNCEVGYCSVSEQLVYGISDLLVEFGIKHVVTEKQVKYNGGLNNAYQILIRNKEDILNFANNINIFTKEDAVQNVVDNLKNRSDMKNGYFYQVPKEASNIYNIKTPRKYGIRKQYNTCKTKLLKAAKDQGIIDLINICESDTYFDEIVSITSNGKHQTYAIEVPDTHNYITGNIITHNTVVFCADMLWWTIAKPLADMYENNGKKQVPIDALILTPMDAQIKMIFDTILQLCADSPLIKDQITKIKRSDVSEIHFKNGSKIKGMTIGISSSNKGTSIRGQCLTGDTIITMSNGNTKRIDSIKQGDIVSCINNNNKLISSEVTHVFSPNTKTVFSVKLQSGREIKCSEDHKLYTCDKTYKLGWKPLKEIESDQYLSVINKSIDPSICNNIVYNDIHLDKIISITKIGVKKTYDIEVKGPENFIANGIVVHNSADYMFLDEADYIPREIIEETILPIFSTNKNCVIRACSTPSGRRDLYYDWCSRKELGWWHRHYPSWHKDNPSWISIDYCKKNGIPLAESTEFQFRSTTTNETYAREYGAEFGEENQGVYKHDLLEKSMVKYVSNYTSYDTDIFDPGFTQNPNNIYVIGVDWNTYKNGGQVVMIEYCREPTFIEYFDHETNNEVRIDCTGKFRMFYRRGVKSKEATQRETRNEIIRLMNIYKIDHLYVDYGAGDTNTEELTFYGKQHPHLRIGEKLHVIDSGSNIEHYDPVLRKKIKKRAKSLMINQSVVGLEEGKMILPKEEDSNHRLIKQMRNYIVKNVTVKGDFTYAGEDHVLDAFVLAIWGFYHQHSLLINTSYENRVKFMANPMLKNAPIRANESSVKSPILNITQNIRDPEAPPLYNVPRMVKGKTYTRNSNAFGTRSRSQL